MTEEIFLSYYIFGWPLFLAATLALLIRYRATDPLFSRSYWRFLTEPWKLVTFIISGLAVTLAGPYTSDPTWDHVDGGFMSVLTYISAPWAIARLYQWATGKLRLQEVFPAIGLMLFSASWSYDLYLYWRDGFYPPTWLSNLIVSTVIYISAGLMWNLLYQPGIGVTFAFQDPRWPSTPYSIQGSRKLFLMALPFMLLAAYLTVSLFITH